MKFSPPSFSKDQRRLIIGLGSGRCGTVSLANLLNLQPDVSVTHEFCSMPWEFDENIWNWNMSRLFSGEKPYDKKIIGDVGFYWINHIERLIDLKPDTKFICLKRDREGTVNSYMEHSSGLNVHPESDWFRLFPRYNLPEREAVGAMWDDYYERANLLQEKYAGSFLIMGMDEALNTTEGMTIMMGHLGIDTPIIKTGIRLNASMGG